MTRYDELRFTQKVSEIIARIRGTCARNGWDPLEVIKSEVLIGGLNTSIEQLRTLQASLSMTTAMDLENIRTQIHNVSERSNRRSHQ